MEFKDMSSIRKQLVTAMLIGQMFREAQGMVATENTKFMNGENEMHCIPIKERLKTGSIISMGKTEQDMKSYEIMETLVDQDTVILKEVVFFRAKLSSGSFISTYCVAASDKLNAYEILKTFCKDKGYKIILSVNPCTLFEPLIK